MLSVRFKGKVYTAEKFHLIQFDGKAVTCDNHNGLLPELIESAGFNKVELREEIGTIFGTRHPRVLFSQSTGPYSRAHRHE